MTDKHAIPDDFPREPWPALVPGSQPKVLVREKDGRYGAALTDDELWMRYESCEDLARQLASYALRKMFELGCSLDDALARVEKSVTRKVNHGSWEYSAEEVVWTMRRTYVLLSGPPDAKDARVV
ncbi:hypothetical protein ACRPM7_20745 [Burkholderia vietnamiensis]|uniref:hypothetical protein n=1 Tax=Burkholderia vietnamiensis TaxID=60552 RepID=UPI0009BDAFA1|nr:hypothetical protein [Burkholderia vietnamiensis]MDN8115629.1 hypothetical protein [Burkholderia vietnamiensis]QTK86449.1 hypothetical protein J4D21_21960 [Burkholderia vietnamiensis]HDR9140978.1 hypothetical protein [Burkholderia vietnamiensis]HDR9317246.1 hypothetical protein [Burkholderia vietnamiensis]